MEVTDNLRKIFLFGIEQSERIKCLSLEVRQLSDKSIVINQHNQMDKFQAPVISHERRTQMDEDLVGEATICDQLNWLSSQSRPNLKFNDCDLLCFVKSAKVSHLLKDVKLVSKAHSERVRIKFAVLNLSRCSILINSDASYGCLPDGSSQGGFIIFLCDERERCVPITWSTTKIKRIVRSTLAAECMALQDTTDTGILISSLFSELMDCESEPLKIVCKTDSKGLYKALFSAKCVQDKCRTVDIVRLCQMMEREEVSQVCWVDSRLQLAGCLTKRTASSR